MQGKYLKTSVSLFFLFCVFLSFLSCFLAVEAEDKNATTETKTTDLSNLLGLENDEILKRLEHLFSLIDTNKDSVLDTKEMEDWLNILNIQVQVKHVNIEFASLDHNKDNFIDFDEMKSAYNVGEGHSEQEDKDLRLRFDAVDKDKDGKLNMTEVSILMDPVRDPLLLKIEANDIFQAQDINKDGTISLEEFMTPEDGSELKEEDKEELQKEFKHFDLNSDGKIDKEEVEKIIGNPLPSDVEHVLGEIKKLAKDGKIPLDEWKLNYQKYAVSPLTDNAELLRFPEDYQGLNFPFKNLQPKQDHDEL